MSFLCGSFRSQQQEDDYDVLWPFPSTSPRKPTRRRKIFGSRRDKTATNPYSDRGLDKFEALLADLEEKRQKILTQKGSDDVSMVKFIYRDQNEAQPVIVKLQDQREHDNISSLDHQKDVFVKETEDDNKKPLVDEPVEKIMIRFDHCRRKFGEWWKPSYYLPLFVILILVFLMFSGRTFTILCTSIGWYLVPVINGIIDDSKKANNKEKKEYSKRSRRAHI